MKNVLTVLLAGVLMVGSTFAFAEDVYATKNGKKYHKMECVLIKNKDVKAIVLEDAQKKGLKPCNRCFSTKIDAAAQNKAGMEKAKVIASAK